MKTLLAISLLTISLTALADPVASRSALNYSADQSTPPIATKPTNTQVEPAQGKTTRHTLIKRLKHTTKHHNNQPLINKK